MEKISKIVYNGTVCEVKDAAARQELEETVQSISINGVEQSKLNHAVDLPAYPTKQSLGIENVEDKTSAQIRNELTSENVTNALGYTPLDEAEKGQPNGVAQLDNTGRVPTSQLPSYVDDVQSYTTKSEFPLVGEDGKIYIDKEENKQYRWDGSDYAEISASLALGETPSTAYPGDKGAAAYAHAVTNKGNEYANGFYKIGTNSEGHVTSATTVVKQDILDLGIEDTDTKVTSASNHYTPVQASTIEKDADDGDSAIWDTTNFVTGIVLKIDEKGHVTGLDLESSKMPIDPTANLGTAAYTDSTAYATAAQGEKADNALATRQDIIDALGFEPAEDDDVVTLIKVGATEYPPDDGVVELPEYPTKASLGLENVENKSVEQIFDELTSEDITDTLGYTPATTEQGEKADSAVQSITVGGVAQPKNNGTVALPAYPTKESLDIGNVENKSASEIIDEITGEDIIDALGYTPARGDSSVTGAKIGAVAYSPDASGTLNFPAYPTKDSLGLENVENKSAATILDELTPENVVEALGYTPARGDSSVTGAKIGTTEYTPDANGVLNFPAYPTRSSLGLGTAATMNVPSASDVPATSSQVVRGDDPRLKDARPASDVSNWAKASTKPTYSAAEVGALANTTKYGKSIDIDVDSEYKVTIVLKDQNGTQLSSDYIDLPLESVVVGGRYDKDTQKVILTLQNEETIAFSVAELVSGLQSEITSSNKLSSDLVDDTNKTHKFATATQLAQIETNKNNIANKADKSTAVTNVTYSTTSKKLTKTINGTTSDVVTVATLKTDMGLDNVENKSASDIISEITPAAISAATAAQGTKADSAVQTIQINGTTQTKTNGVVNLPAYPTTLKNPNALKVQGNGTDSFTYDGSAAKTLNIKAGNNITIGSDTSGNITINGTANTWTAMVGATSSANGSVGYVNAVPPKDGYNTKFLRADGSWNVPPDTKVTSAANHYTPSTASGSDKTASASGATAAWSIDVVKGVTLNTDGKGHVTGLSVTSGKIPANPNTDTKVTSVGNHYTPAEDTSAVISKDASSTTAATWNSTSLVTGIDVKRDAKGHVVDIVLDSIKMPANPNSNTTYTLSSGTNDGTLKLTPSSGTAQDNIKVKGWDDLKSLATNATHFKGGFTASGDGIIDGGSTTLKSVAEAIGDVYTCTTAGTIYGIAFEIGDSIIFKKAVAAGTAPASASGTPATSTDFITVEGETSVSVVDNNPTLSWGSKSKVATIEGTEINVTMPSNPNTDTKVTSAANHYAPATVSGSDKSASATGATAAWGIDVVKGVTLNTDGKGHVTGLSVTSGKVPANPNTDRYVNTATFADDTTSSAANPVKMTLTRAGSDSATVTANIPKVSSTSAGVAPKGAAVSSQSQTTKFLREDGTWAAPSYTTNTNTTYTFSNGTTNGTFKVKPSNSSTTQEVSIGGLGTAAYTASTAYAAASHNQASNTINAMTGYSKPSSTSAISTLDSLNAAIGKLEKALDGKASTSSLNGYLPTAGGTMTGDLIIGNDAIISSVNSTNPTEYWSLHFNNNTAGSSYLRSPLVFKRGGYNVLSMSGGNSDTNILFSAAYQDNDDSGICINIYQDASPGLSYYACLYPKWSEELDEQYSCYSRLGTLDNRWDAAYLVNASISNNATIGGAATISGSLKLNNVSSSTGSVLIIDSNGKVCTQSSTRTIKHDIEYVNNDLIYHDALMNFKPATFIYNTDESNTPKLGMIAEDVDEVCPIASLKNEDGSVQNYDDRAIIAMLVMEVQRLNKELEELKQ